MHGLMRGKRAKPSNLLYIKVLKALLEKMLLGSCRQYKKQINRNKHYRQKIINNV